MPPYDIDRYMHQHGEHADGPEQGQKVRRALHEQAEYGDHQYSPEYEEVLVSAETNTSCRAEPHKLPGWWREPLRSEAVSCIVDLIPDFFLDPGRDGINVAAQFVNDGCPFGHKLL